MHKNTNLIFKLSIIILLCTLIFITLLNISNFFEINKSKIVSEVNKKTVTKKIEFNKNILYVSRHDGTISNFKIIAELLSFNVSLYKPSVSTICIYYIYIYLILNVEKKKKNFLLEQGLIELLLLL